MPHRGSEARRAVAVVIARGDVRRCALNRLAGPCELATNPYAKGIKVTNAETATLDITGDDPEWSYTISPRSPKAANFVQ